MIPCQLSGEKSILKSEYGLKVCLLAFNSSEDLVLLTVEGELYLIDIVQKKLRDKVKLSGYFEDGGVKKKKKPNIEQAKFESEENVLVFSTGLGRFYFLKNVSSGAI